MSLPNTASDEAWVNAYERVYFALPASAHVPCPNCRHDALRVVFTGRTEDRVGYASLWCDHCLNGIHLSTVDIPPGVDILPLHMSLEDRRKIVPKYALVPEDGDDEGELA
jgi:hypothetical protein